MKYKYTMCDKMPSFRFMVSGTYSYHWAKMIKHAPSNTR